MVGDGREGSSEQLVASTRPHCRAKQGKGHLDKNCKTFTFSVRKKIPFPKFSIKSCLINIYEWFFENNSNI
jgi:hypothetical protein